MACNNGFSRSFADAYLQNVNIFDYAKAGEPSRLGNPSTQAPAVGQGLFAVLRLANAPPSSAADAICRGHLWHRTAETPVQAPRTAFQSGKGHPAAGEGTALESPRKPRRTHGHARHSPKGFGRPVRISTASTAECKELDAAVRPDAFPNWRCILLDLQK